MLLSPPKGKAACCRSFKSDLRVTGHCASAARVVMSADVTSFSMEAQPEVVLARVIKAGNAANSSCSRVAGSRASNASSRSDMAA